MEETTKITATRAATTPAPMRSIGLERAGAGAVIARDVADFMAFRRPWVAVWGGGASFGTAWAVELMLCGRQSLQYWRWLKVWARPRVKSSPTSRLPHLLQ